MLCPNCRRELPDTALRCRYCRKPISREKREKLGVIFRKIIDRSIKVLHKRIETESLPWSYLEAIIIVSFAILLLFYDPFNLSLKIMEFLRLNFFIFTKEPMLLKHLSIYIRNIVFKLWILVAILALLSVHRAPFFNSLKLKTPIPKRWFRWLPLFIIFSVIIRIIFDRNPIAPNLPLNSVFPDAAIIGNAVTLIAVILFAPVIEEIFFRGFIFPTVNKIFGVYIAVVITSVFFTLAHFRQFEDWFFLSIIFLLSVIFTLARAFTRSTRLPIILHHIYNLTYIAVGFIKFFALGY